ncbi:MAG: hypothetical protein ACYDCT_09610 [Dehalococcoidia bacterium]
MTAADRGGLDPRPPCRGGERTGDLVDGWLMAQCEGMYLRPGGSAIVDALTLYVDEPLPFYAAYRTPTQWGPGIFYTAVFSSAATSPGRAMVLLFNDQGVVGTGTGCGNSAAALGAGWPLLGAPVSASPTPARAQR